jgi:hypothetical protein
MSTRAEADIAADMWADTHSQSGTFGTVFARYSALCVATHNVHSPQHFLREQVHATHACMATNRDGCCNSAAPYAHNVSLLDQEAVTQAWITCGTVLEQQCTLLDYRHIITHNVQSRHL